MILSYSKITEIANAISSLQDVKGIQPKVNIQLGRTRELLVVELKRYQATINEIIASSNKESSKTEEEKKALVQEIQKQLNDLANLEVDVPIKLSFSSDDFPKETPAGFFLVMSNFFNDNTE